MNDAIEPANAKQALRKEKIRWRSSLSAEEALVKAQRIADTVRALPEYARARTILFYVSAKANEVDTHALIREALSRGVRALVPVTDFDRRELIVSELKNMDELAPVRFGLLEPRGDSIRPTDPRDADVIIVPGVAFDRECRRMGFGGGYYDRLLATSNATTIALSYDGQLVELVPTDANDMPVDILVTETRIYRISSTS
jgi:5-formyltetrahydrofolate cyclo-ligase